MVKAVGDNVIVRVLVRDRTTSGIVIPTNVQEPQSYGRVLSVGENVKHVSVKEGDIIVCHLNAGQLMVFDNEILRVVKDGEIYGVLEDESIIKTLKDQDLRSGKENA